MFLLVSYLYLSGDNILFESLKFAKMLIIAHEFVVSVNKLKLLVVKCPIEVQSYDSVFGKCLEFGCLRNSVPFFTSIHSVCCTELAKIPWNCTEFCVAELRRVSCKNSAEVKSFTYKISYSAEFRKVTSVNTLLGIQLLFKYFNMVVYIIALFRFP
jgi:hypothetical protein